MSPASYRAAPPRVAYCTVRICGGLTPTKSGSVNVLIGRSAQGFGAAPAFLFFDPPLSRGFSGSGGPASSRWRGSSLLEHFDQPLFGGPAVLQLRTLLGSTDHHAPIDQLGLKSGQGTGSKVLT